MNRSPLNGSLLGSGVSTSKINAAAITQFVLVGVASGFKYAGLVASTSLTVTTTAVLKTQRAVAGFVDLELTTAAIGLVKRLRFIGAYVDLVINHSAFGNRKVNLNSSTDLEITSSALGSRLVQIFASTTMSLGANGNSIVNGSPAPADRQMVVQQTDRLMVV